MRDAVTRGNKAEERRTAVTAVTKPKKDAVTPKSAPLLGVTVVTTVTAKKQRDEIAREIFEERAAIREHKAGIIEALKTAINDPEISPEKGKTDPPANVAANDPASSLVIEAVPAERRAASCLSCAHLRQPGFSAGYCGSPERRDDLPPAYGAGHPLRQLPGDQGKSCRAYRGAVEAAPDTIAERGQQ